MKLKLFLIVATLAVLSFLAGWWRAGLSATLLPPEKDQWVELVDANVDSSKYRAVAARLRESDIFPVSRSEAKRLEEIKNSAQIKTIEGAPEFPSIIAASVLDDVPHVHLLLEDESLIKAKEGDVLDSGWELISVDLKRVSAVYGGREQEFWVDSYDEGLVKNKEK